MTSSKWLIAVGVLAVAVAMPVQAQEAVQGYVAGGYVLPEGKAGDFLNGGWNISGGAIWRPASDLPFGLRFDLGYSDMGANSTAVNLGQQAGYRVDGGSMSMWDLTVEGLWEFGNPDKVGGYVGAGFGGYYRNSKLTANVTQVGTICDPWWGCYYTTYTGDQTIVDDSLTKFGYNVAAGITFAVGSGQMYLETRYHWMSSDPTTQIFPILIGYRF